MPVGESIREVYVPKNPPTLVARSCQRTRMICTGGDRAEGNLYCIPAGSFLFPGLIMLK